MKSFGGGAVKRGGKLVSSTRDNFSLSNSGANTPPPHTTLTPPIYLSTKLLFARSRDRSSILIRDSFASHDSSSVWRLLVENPINSSPRTQIPLDIIVDASSLQSDRSIIQFCGNSIISSIRVSLIVPIIADRIIIWII